MIRQLSPPLNQNSPRSPSFNPTPRNGRNGPNVVPIKTDIVSDSIIPQKEISAHTTNPGSLKESMIFDVNHRDDFVHSEWVIF